MIKRAMVALGFAGLLLGFAPSADAQLTIYAPYSCVGNCLVQGGCTKAFYYNNTMMFRNEVGQESPGAFTGPTQVTAFLWGLQGDVYPDMIVWHYPGRAEYARWVKNYACPAPF
jgi:hypothetical protein